MSENEIRVLKANILGGMNTYVRDVVGDDNATDIWNQYGVADGATEEEIMEEAENGFKNIVQIFAYLLKKGII